MQQQRVLLGGGVGEVPDLMAGEPVGLGVDSQRLVVRNEDVAAASRQLVISSASTPSSAARSRCRAAASAAADRFSCAIRFVYTLLSATALYSSGPVTPSIRNRPLLSWWPSERHSRAVCTSRSKPIVCSKAVSSVARTYRTAAPAISALTWKAADPAGQ